MSKKPNQEALDRIQHTCKEPFNCSNCNKNFMQDSDLKQHETFHTCEKPFNCSHCDKKSAHKSNLKQHETAHTWEEPFNCSYCDKKFMQESSTNCVKIFSKKSIEYSWENCCGCSSCDFTWVETCKVHTALIKLKTSPYFKSQKRIDPGKKPFSAWGHSLANKQN